MAARFVIAVALFALCTSEPVGRQRRAYSVGEGYATGYGGRSQASANVNGGVAQAFGSSSNGAGFGRDGFGNYYPGQAITKAETYDTPANAGYGTAKATAQANNGGDAYYRAVPAPATVITYEQKFETPTQFYGYPAQGATSAESTAVLNGDTESSISSVRTSGGGSAQSDAQTHRGAESTSTNAKTSGLGYGSADSNAKSTYGSVESTAKTQGSGSASSSAANNGAGFGTPVAPSEDLESTVISAKKQNYYVHAPLYTPTLLGSISSNTVNGQYGAAKSPTIYNSPKTLVWRFGTAYDNPAGYVNSNTNSGYGLPTYTANTNGYGSAKSTANTNGYGSAKSTANTNGYGSADAKADINNAYGYGGIANSAANTNGYGLAKSTADTAGSLYGGSRTVADAQSNGFGSANSSAKTQGVHTAYRVANSAANSFGSGSARANAQSA